MRKITTLLALVAILVSNSLCAESNEIGMNDVKSGPRECFQSGKIERQAPKEPECKKEGFAWGIAICGLAVVCTVVGFTASMASQSN